MPRPCTVCTHADRGAIDAAMVAGEPFRRIAARAGLAETSLRRHREHIPRALAKAAKAREGKEIAHGQSIHEQVVGLIGRFDELVFEARSTGDIRSALVGLSQIRETLKLVVDMTSGDGELAKSEEWRRVRACIVGALRPFPEAGRAVLMALEAERL